LLQRHADVHRFVKTLTAFRQRRDVVAEGAGLSLNQLLHRAQIDWHGVTLNRPDWGEQSHSLAVTLQSLHGRFLFHVMLNAYWESLTFELPPVAEGSHQYWRRCIDTALSSPDDIYAWKDAPIVSQATYEVQPRSLVLLAQWLPGAGDPNADDESRLRQSPPPSPADPDRTSS
jgi:glycogen operon protein